MFQIDEATAALDDLRAANQSIWRAEVDAVRALQTLADRYQVDELAAEDAAAAIGDRLPMRSNREADLRWLCLEVGAALGISPASAGYRVAQALALRDRHPQLWAAVQAGRLRLWQARDVISRCAGLDVAACHQVDEQVARWCGQLPWTRMVQAVEAAVLAADPAGARERRETEDARRFVHVGAISNGHTDVVGRLSAGDGIALDQALDGIADAYLDPASPWHRSVSGVQQARAIALGELARTALGQDTLLMANDQPATATMSSTPTQQVIQGWADACARPESLRDVLRDEAVAAHHHHALVGDTEAPGTGDERGLLPVPFANPARPRPPVRPRGWRVPPITRTATVVVHISDQTLRDPDGLVRVDGWGPILRDQLADVLAGMKITVRPIVDAATMTASDCYEIPERVRFAVTQRNPVDVFPYATRPSRSCDLDHTVPWPRGDTHSGNLGPLSRTTHLAKTLKLWHLDQPEPGVFLWTSPLKQRYLVTAQGSLAIPG